MKELEKIPSTYKPVLLKTMAKLIHIMVLLINMYRCESWIMNMSDRKNIINGYHGLLERQINGL